MTDHAAEHLAHALKDLADAVRHASSQSRKNSILNRLDTMETHIMSAISDFAAKQAAFNDRIDAAVTGLGGDVASLKDEILKLQNSSGAITPEDQASLDAIQARTETIATKLEALDALTPPTPPTV